VERQQGRGHLVGHDVQDVGSLGRHDFCVRNRTDKTPR
jgi:hypothetical protein